MLPLYEGRPAAGRQLVVTDFEGRTVLDGASATVPKPATPRVPESRVVARRVPGPTGTADEAVALLIFLPLMGALLAGFANEVFARIAEF